MLFTQQRANFIARIIRQRSNRFGGYPRQEHADTHIDGEVEHNVHCVAHACAMEAVIKEYVEGLENQHLPHDQGKTFFPQKLCKVITKQSVIAEATMYANDHEACAKSIERNNVYEARQ